MPICILQFTFRNARTLSIFFLCLYSSHATSHPVDLGNYDRTIQVRLNDDGVTIHYRLEISQITAVNDVLKVDRQAIARLSKPKEFYDAFAREFGPILAANIIAKLDGKELEFTCVSHQYELLDHLRVDFVFKAPWKLSNESHKFTFREGNYEHDSGLIRVSLETGPRLRTAQKHEPSEELKARPISDWKPGDEESLRTASAQFALSDEAPTTSTESPAAPAVEEVSKQATSDEGLLRLFLNSERGFWTMLLIAVGLGAAHALTPGHGKTLVAAYLVGQRGTVWHALLLGIITTLTHTGVVLVLALALYWFYPQGMTEEVQRNVDTALGGIGGLLIAGLGIWLLLRRLTGQADHFHLPGQGHHHHHGHAHGAHDHHHHEHGHDHAHAEHFHDEHGHTHSVPADAGKWGLIVMGIQGGIVPCWDAVVLLLAAVAMNLLYLAFPLLLAFSAGLAGVLVLIGILVVKARGLAGARWSESRLFKALPILSALLITALGLWLCYDRMHFYSKPPAESASARP